MSSYFDLGNYSRRISTDNADARTWFNRGLIWCYGFNQEEGVRCFEKVIEIDPDCAMGYWGIAYASGPFYNKPWEWYGEIERIDAIALCREYALKANKLKAGAAPVETRSAQPRRWRRHPRVRRGSPRWSSSVRPRG